MSTTSCNRIYSSSPSTRALDRAVKMRRYAELGIRHYWILDPDTVRL